MTVLTIAVECYFEFLDIATVLGRAVACATLLNRLTLIPDVFTVLIDVMAFPAFHLIIFGVTAMRKADRPFAIRLVTLVFNQDVVRHIVGA